MPAPGRVERRSFNGLPQQVRKDLIAAVAGGRGAPLVASRARNNNAFCFAGLAVAVVALGFLVTGHELLFVLTLAVGLWLLVSWDSGRRGLRRDPLASGTYLFSNHLLIVTGPDLEVVPNELITRQVSSTDGCALTVFFPGNSAVLRAPIAADLHRAITRITRTRTVGPEDPGPDDVIAPVLNSRRLDDGQAPRWTPPYPLLGAPTPLHLGIASVLAAIIVAVIAVPLCPVHKIPFTYVAWLASADDIDSLIYHEDMAGIHAYLLKNSPPREVLRQIDDCCKAHYDKVIAAYRKKSGHAKYAEFAIAYFTWAGTHRAAPLVVHFIPGTDASPAGSFKSDGPHVTMVFAPNDLAKFQARAFQALVDGFANGTDGDIHAEQGKDAADFGGDAAGPSVLVRISAQPSGKTFQEVNGSSNLQYAAAEYPIAVRFDAPGHVPIDMDYTVTPPDHFVAHPGPRISGLPPDASTEVIPSEVDDGMYTEPLGYFAVTITNAFIEH